MEIDKTALIVSLSVLVYVVIMLFVGLLCYFFVCNKRRKGQREKEPPAEVQRSRPPSQQRKAPDPRRPPPGIYPDEFTRDGPEMRRKPPGVKQPKVPRDGRHSAPSGGRKSAPVQYPEIRHPAPVWQPEVRRPQTRHPESPREHAHEHARAHAHAQRASQPPRMPANLAMLFEREDAPDVAPARGKSRGSHTRDVTRHSTNDVSGHIESMDNPYADIGRMSASGPVGPDILRHSRQPMSYSQPLVDPSTGEQVYSQPDKRRSRQGRAGSPNRQRTRSPSPQPSDFHPPVPDKEENLLERYLTEQRTSRESKSYDTAELDTFY